MSLLKKITAKFAIQFDVIGGQSGVIRGVMSETDQNSQPSYIFVAPRHVLRVEHPTAFSDGTVIRSPGGDVYLVGYNGPSETWHGTLWKSFRLFRISGQYSWERRTRVQDPITRVDKEGPVEDKGLIWAVIEPMDREQSDREMRQNFEQARFITNAAVVADDVIDGRRVTKVDRQLGLSIGVLT